MSRIVSRFSKALEKVEHVVNFIGTAFIIVIMLLVTSDVVYRTISGSSIFGVLELVSLLLVGVALLTFAHAQNQRAHIRMALLTTRLKGNWRNLAEIFSLTAFLLFAIIATYAGVIRAAHSVSIQETISGLTAFPVWPSKLLIPTGYFLLCLRLIVQIAQQILPSEKEAVITDAEPEF